MATVFALDGNREFNIPGSTLHRPLMEQCTATDIGKMVPDFKLGAHSPLSAVEKDKVRSHLETGCGPCLMAVGWVKA
jgi:hypothetical protein